MGTALTVALALPAGAGADVTITFPTTAPPGPYTPATVTIAAGETVTWSGNLAAHPLVSLENLWVTAAAGNSFSHRFALPGTFRFLCQAHPVSMTGSVVVAAGDPGPGPSPSGGPGPSPAPPAPSPAAPVSGPAADRTAPAAAYKGANRLRGRRPRIVFTTSEPGSATATLTARGRRLARATARFSAPGRHAVRLRLRRARKGVASLTLVVRDGAGNAATVRRRVTLGR